MTPSPDSGSFSLGLLAHAVNPCGGRPCRAYLGLAHTSSDRRLRTILVRPTRIQKRLRKRNDRQRIAMDHPSPSPPAKKVPGNLPNAQYLTTSEMDPA